jgi:predicted 3-demethylubiquinone-9 3-methyltransferase (glyoxalase superfamily)
MPQPVPSLWFETGAMEGAEHYTSIFPNSEITAVSHYGEGGPMEAGTVLTVDFVLDGQRFSALNGGPHHTFNDAVSFVISCQDQDEVDHYWSKLSEGGQEVQCGWLKDKFGVSWQVVPAELQQLLGDPDPGRAHRALQAMLTMTKLDLVALRAAADQSG